MNIVKRIGTITKITDLTKTAREVVVTLAEPLECMPGSFVNFFMDVGDARLRRAFSVVSTDSAKKTITFAIRLSPRGTVTPEFWKPDIVGRTVEVMGPLGINTADKLSHPTLHLFAFGIGAGVIKSIAEYSLSDPNIATLTITTGSRNGDDILYRDYFDSLAQTHPHVSVRHVLSRPQDEEYPLRGYIHEHVKGLNFNNSDIYMCGQEAACNSLLATIDATNPKNSTTFVEAFH